MCHEPSDCCTIPNMVKRNDIKPGVIVKVKKVMPEGSQPSITFLAKALEIDELLEVKSVPLSLSRGGMSIVPVKRLSTGESIDLMYSFVTNYCTQDKRT